MVTIQEALRIIKNEQVILKSAMHKLETCLGYSLSKNIIAAFDMPSFDNSAMDGYALCGMYKEYTIVGEIAAGDGSELTLQEGEAVRIFTGAKIPDYTTLVMMQEKTTVSGNKLYLNQAPLKGQNIRKKGEEIKKDQVVFEKGYTITPAGIGMLGSLGFAMVDVFNKPIVSLIATGNELVLPGKAKQQGQIYESNSFALAAACEKYGFECLEKKQIEDNFEAIKAGIKESFEKTDVLILSGGISVGDYDFVKQALEENGVEELFYKVFQKPGKPLYFGRKGDKFVFALPGNPASSLSCFYIYVLPLLYKLSGSSKTGLDHYKFPASRDFENRSNRPIFFKANIDKNQVEILEGQGSSMILSMALGNALAFLDAETLVKKGDAVTCYLIS